MASSLVNGINQVPQVSFWSGSPLLSDKDTYPYFSRTTGGSREYVDAMLKVVLRMFVVQ